MSSRSPALRITAISGVGIGLVAGALTLVVQIAGPPPELDPTLLTALLLAHPLGLLGINRLTDGERVTTTLIEAPMVLAAVCAGPVATIVMGVPALVLGEVRREDSDLSWRLAKTLANLLSGLIALLMIAGTALLVDGQPPILRAVVVAGAAAAAVPLHTLWTAWMVSIATGGSLRLAGLVDGMPLTGATSALAASAGLGMLLIGEPVGVVMLLPVASWVMAQHQQGAIAQELHEATTVLDLLVDTTSEATAADATEHITSLAAQILNCRTVEIVAALPPEMDGEDALAVPVDGLGWMVATERLATTPFDASHRKMLVRIGAVSRAAIQSARSRDALRRTAHTDPLTGLPNRTGLHEAVKVENPDAVLLIDLDRFKAINDVHGHAAGDAVLRATADRLMRTIRSRDVAARLGGDEFVVVLSNLRQHDEAALVAERIEVMLRAPIDWEGRILQVGASVGVQLVGDDQPIEEALRLADRQMYAVKAAHHAQEAAQAAE